MVVLEELLFAIGVLCALFFAGEAGPATSPDPAAGETDEELMQRYAQGDARAFNVLMSRYQRRVYGYIVRNIFDKDKASDLFQESFYKLIRAASSFDPGQRFSTWMFTIVRHTLIDHYKKRRLRTASLSAPFRSDDDRTLADRIPDRDSPEGEGQAMKSQLEIKLQDVLAHMNPDQREVFLLRHYEGMPFADIAQLMDCPENTAKTRMRYALELLKKELVEFL